MSPSALHVSCSHRSSNRFAVSECLQGICIFLCGAGYTVALHARCGRHSSSCKSNPSGEDLTCGSQCSRINNRTPQIITQIDLLGDEPMGELLQNRLQVPKSLVSPHCVVVANNLVAPNKETNLPSVGSACILACDVWICRGHVEKWC